MKAMPTVELTKQQLLSVIEQLDEDEWQWIEETRKNKHISKTWYLSFTRNDSLWKAVGIGHTKDGYVARNHDKYIYQKEMKIWVKGETTGSNVIASHHCECSEAT